MSQTQPRANRAVLQLLLYNASDTEYCMPQTLIEAGFLFVMLPDADNSNATSTITNLSWSLSAYIVTAMGQHCAPNELCAAANNGHAWMPSPLLYISPGPICIQTEDIGKWVVILYCSGFDTNSSCWHKLQHMPMTVCSTVCLSMALPP